MKNIFLKPIIALTIVAITLFSCKSDDDVTVPDVGIDNPDNLEANVDLSFVEDLYEGTIVEFDKVQNGGELITSGLIISSDDQGNINQEIYIQDKAEDAESGVIIDVAVDNIFVTHGVGREVLVKLNGLGMQKVGNALHIGTFNNGTITPISSDDFKTFVIRTNTKTTIVPKKLTIGEIIEAAESDKPEDALPTILVSLEDVQVIDGELSTSYANADNNENVNKTLIGCTGSKTIALHNSGLSKFKALPFPTGNGSITAILTKDVLTIRSPKDIDFSGDRCGTGIETGTNITIADVVAKADGANLVKFNDVTFTNVPSGADPIFTGYTISSDEQKNINNELYLQSSPENPNAGIIIDFELSNLYNTYAIGQKVSVNLNGLAMQVIDGNLHIGALNTAEDAIQPIQVSASVFDDVIVPSSDPLETIVPTVTTIEDIQAGTIVPLTMIQLENVQLSDENQGQAYGDPTNKQLFNCDTKAKIAFKNSADATFAAETVSVNNGNITAILAHDGTANFLTINALEDINFTEIACDEKEVLLDEDFESITSVGFNIALSGWENINNSVNIKWNSDESNSNIFAEIKNGGPSDQYDAWLITEEMQIINTRTLNFSMDINVSERDGDYLEIFILNMVGNDFIIGDRINMSGTSNNIVPQADTTELTPVSTTINVPNNQDAFHIGFRYRKQTGPASTDYQIDNIKVVEE